MSASYKRLTLVALPSLLGAALPFFWQSHCFAQSASSIAADISSCNFTGELDEDGKPFRLTGSNCSITISGAPTEMSVEGHNNNVQAPSGCTSINVSGNNNVVHVGLVTKITIEGANNTVQWTGPKTVKAPIIINNGPNNQIARISLANAQTETIDPAKSKIVYSKSQATTIVKSPSHVRSKNGSSSTSAKVNESKISVHSSSATGKNYSVDISLPGMQVKAQEESK